LSIAGPLPSGGQGSPTGSLYAYTPASGPYSTGIIYFNTDDAAPEPPGNEFMTMIIRDASNNEYMQVEFLRVRNTQNQTFGFRLTPGGTLYIKSFPYNADPNYAFITIP